MFGQRRLSYRQQLALFLSPYLLGAILLVLLPALATVALSFTHYSSIQPPVWIELENYRQVYNAPVIRLSLRNTMIFWAMAVPLRLLIALGLAILLQRRGRSTSFFRGAVYLPTIIPEAAYALIWLWILNPVTGPLNLLLTGLGLPAPAWLTEPGLARVAIALMALFQIGEGFVVLLVGRQSIPQSLYESAALDGANAWQSFRHITLPMLAPWLMLLLFRDLIVSLQNTFTPSFILTYGGPYYATTFLPLMVFELFFDFSDIGLASALLVVAYIIIGLLIFGVHNIIVGLRGSEDG